jgi:hypothetical protein
MTLKGRMSKDSHNSSNPPSRDGYAKKTSNLRKKSGKKPGGQTGHRLCMLVCQLFADGPHASQDKDDERSQ